MNKKSIFTLDQLNKLVPDWTQAEYEEDLGFDICLTLKGCRELVRLAKLGLHMENTRRNTHLAHCNGDDRYCNWREAHEEAVATS